MPDHLGQSGMRTEAEIRAMLERLNKHEPPHDPAVIVAAAEALEWVLGITDYSPGDLDEEEDDA